MSFFNQQDQARRNTVKLIALFALAMLGLIVAVSLLVAGGLVFSGGEMQVRNLDTSQVPIFVAVALGVCAVVLLGSMFRRAQLSKGGKSVAESLGGRLLSPNTRDFDEKRLLNVVEEMALAAGVAVPPVYLIDDNSINAFAAGFRQQDAVIGVTRGTMQLLNREEIQGVIAHEFSHIIHGDMRINIRLIGWLYGIMMLGLVGRFIVRSMQFRALGSSRNDRGAGAGIVVLGIGLIVVGFAGSFFGSLIKAAVSRQREYLADASAVQYTRNPVGIAGALKKIGGHTAGSRLSAAGAEEFSHMFFGAALQTSFSSLFATHPPLAERIRRIEPNWNGQLITPKHESAQDDDRAQNTAALTRGFAAGAANEALPKTDIAQGLQQSMAAMGNPTEVHLHIAQEQLNKLGDQLIEAAHEPYSARALAYGLLLSQDQPLRQEQLRQLKRIADPQTYALLLALQETLVNLDIQLRLPLLDISFPALKQLSPAQTETFFACISVIMIADQKISLVEWFVFKLLRRHLQDDSATSFVHHPLLACQKEAAQVMFWLVKSTHADFSHASETYSQGARQLQLSVGLHELPVDNYQMLSRALDTLAKLKPLDKSKLMNTLVEVAGVDTPEQVRAAELLRLIADCLDCPLPPLPFAQ